MAFAVGGAGTRIKLFLEFKDSFGQRPVWRQFAVDWNTDLANTVNDAVAIADLVQAVSGMLCELGHIQVVINDGTPDPAEANATRFQDGILTFDLDTAGDGKTPFGTVRIPYPKTTVRVAASGTDFYNIDTGNTAVIALADEYLAAGRLTLNDGQKSESLVGGKVVPVRGKVKLA